jgi:hypothetical protein
MSRVKPTVDLGYPTEAHGRIPAFQNIEEEAAFWDTHDAAGFEGEELQPVELIIGGELAERLTVRLDRQDRELLARQAAAKGITPAALARMWLEERLREEAGVALP